MSKTRCFKIKRGAEKNARLQSLLDIDATYSEVGEKLG